MVRRLVISGAAFCAFAVSSLGWVNPATASSITVGVGHSSDGGCLLGQTISPSQVSISQSCVYNGEHPSSGYAIGDYGLLGVAITAGYTAGAFASFNTASAGASFLADGYILSGPAGTIATSLNFDLSGFLQQTCAARECIESVHLVVTTSTTGSGGDLFIKNGAIIAASGNYNLSGLFGSGGSLFLTTPVFNVTTGVPFGIAIDLSVAGVFLGPGSGTITDDLSHTLSYHVGGPVFNLPAGYTVNGLGVTDNIYASTPPSSTAVPEPGTLGLLAGGLALCGVLVRRARW